MKALAAVIMACVMAFVFFANLYPWIVNGEAWGVVEFEIPRGAAVSEVAEILAEKGLILNEDIFSAGAVFMDIDRKIAAGKYVVQPRMSLLDLYQLLQRGQHQLNFVTLPEGLRLTEAAEVLAGELGMEKEYFMRWARDPDVAAEFGIPARSVEGYLFPDTYDIPPDTHPRDIISTMVMRALDSFARAYGEADSPPDLTRRQVFVLASIVEEEVTYYDEGPRVAAVFLNRLRKGMPLQADPTVAYALGKRKSRITYRDLRVDSPYNTYRHKGLPPGPICNPGENAIRSVLNPAYPSTEMYFVARGDGRHIFSETIDEHIRAKRRVRRQKGAH